MAGTCRILGLFIASVLALMAPAAADAATGEPAPYVAPQGEIVIHPEAGKDTAGGHVVVLNPGRTPTSITVAFQASVAKGIHVASFAPTLLPGRTATRVNVLLSGLQPLESKTDGELVIQSGSTMLASPVSITPPLHASADWPTIIIVGAFVAMLLLAIGICIRALMRDEWRKALCGRAPGPKWTFSSWATTFTAVGAVFGTVLGAVTIPGGKQVDKETLVRINLLFGALVVAAPFVFQSIRSRTASAAQQDAGLWGFNWALLIACSITAGAVLGELGALELLAWEIVGGGVVAWIAIVVLALLQTLAARYFILTTWSLVTTKWDTRAADEKIKAEAASTVLMGLASAVAEHAPLSADVLQPAPKIHSWSLP